MRRSPPLFSPSRQRAGEVRWLSSRRQAQMQAKTWRTMSAWMPARTRRRTVGWMLRVKPRPRQLPRGGYSTLRPSLSMPVDAVRHLAWDVARATCAFRAQTPRRAARGDRHVNRAGMAAWCVRRKSALSRATRPRAMDAAPAINACPETHRPAAARGAAPASTAPCLRPSAYRTEARAGRARRLARVVRGPVPTAVATKTASASREARRQRAEPAARPVNRAVPKPSASPSSAWRSATQPRAPRGAAHRVRVGAEP
jgi:hypothetical protein